MALRLEEKRTDQCAVGVFAHRGGPGLAYRWYLRLWSWCRWGTEALGSAMNLDDDIADVSAVDSSLLRSSRNPDVDDRRRAASAFRPHGRLLLFVVPLVPTSTLTTVAVFVLAVPPLPLSVYRPWFILA